MSWRDSFVGYEVIRRVFLLGLRVRPIFDALDPEERDASVLDVGCGFGHLARYFTYCDYTGIDLDPTRIHWARENLGEGSRRRFIVGDVCRMDLPAKSFDKAIGYGILHHLSDRDASRCLAELARVVKGKIVFSDPVYSKYHVVNNLLCRLDRGEFVRQAPEYLALVGRHLGVERHRVFYARNGLAKYFLIACRPRE